MSLQFYYDKENFTQLETNFTNFVGKGNTLNPPVPCPASYLYRHTCIQNPSSERRVRRPKQPRLDKASKLPKKTLVQESTFMEHARSLLAAFVCKYSSHKMITIIYMYVQYPRRHLFVSHPRPPSPVSFAVS